MKLARRVRRESPETIIALIDVVFFLLVFFMLIGRMDATAPFDVSPAVADTGSDMPGGGATISVSSSGELSLNGQIIVGEDLVAHVNTLLLADPALLVRINAHKDAELRYVLPIVATIEANGARDVVLVVTPSGS